MAKVFSTGQQIAGLAIVVGLILLVGTVLIVGGTAGGWFQDHQGEGGHGVGGDLHQGRQQQKVRRERDKGVLILIHL